MCTGKCILVSRISYTKRDDHRKTEVYVLVNVFWFHDYPTQREMFWFQEYPTQDYPTQREMTTGRPKIILHKER